MADPVNEILEAVRWAAFVALDTEGGERDCAASPYLFAATKPTPTICFSDKSKCLKVSA